MDGSQVHKIRKDIEIELALLKSGRVTSCESVWNVLHEVQYLQLRLGSSVCVHIVRAAQQHMASGLQLPFIDVDCEAVSLDLQLINKIEEMRPDTLTSSDASLCREHRMNLENIRARQEADKLRKKLRREFLVHSYGGSSLTHPESKKLRKYLIDVLHNEELTASHKVAQLKSLVPCVRAIALLICDLDEVASQLDPNVSDSLLREQTSYLNTVFEKMFEMSSLPSDDCVLGMEYILSSWQAMYMYAIRIVQRVHNFCRDPREQRGSPTGVLNSQSQDLTLRMLQSLPLPTELSFSSKTKTWLEHCFEAFRLSCKCLTVYSPTLESMANGFHSVMPIARGDPDFEKYVKKSRECLKLKLGNSVNLGQRLAVTSREGSAVCTAAAIWWKIGGNALRSHSEHMQKAYFEYITQSVGNFKAFADFLDVAVELEGEISTEVENTPVARIYDVVVCVRCDFVADWMRLYSLLLRYRRLVRIKFPEPEFGLISNVDFAISNTMAEWFAACQEEAKGLQIGSADWKFKIHTDTVKAARDFYITYLGIGRQDWHDGGNADLCSRWQQAEWECCSKLVQACSTVKISRDNDKRASLTAQANGLRAIPKLFL